MGRPRFTNAAVGYKGETVPCTVRLPRPVVDFIDEHLTDDLPNRSAVLQDAAAFWCLKEDG